MIILATDIVIKGVLRELERRIAAGEKYSYAISMPVKEIGYEVRRYWYHTYWREEKCTIHAPTGEKTVRISRQSERIPALTNPAYRDWPWWAKAQLLTLREDEVPKEPIVVERCKPPGATYREVMAAIDGLSPTEGGGR